MTKRSGTLEPHVRAVAAVVIVGALMSILDTTIVNVALATLRTELHAPLSEIQWVSTGYLLALATVIPLTGWAAERFGAKRVWMGAVVAFTVTSGLAGLAWSAESLIVVRVLQGLAGGMIMPVGMITLAQTAGPRNMGKVMSVVGVPMLLAPVLGPVIGGLIVTDWSWRWIFWVNLPVGAIGLALAARLLPEGGTTKGEKPLDLRGFLLAGPGLALLVYGLAEVGSAGRIEAQSVVPMLAGILMVAVFVRHELSTRFPLVDIRLFRRAGFAAAAGTVFLLGATLFGALVLLPLYYQEARGLSPLDAGLLMAPQGIGAAVGMSIGGRMTDRVGGGRVVLVGLPLVLLGTLAFTQLTADTSYALLMAALVVRGLGLGGSMMPAMAAAYATIESEVVPRATPMLNVLQRVGGSLGVAVLAVVLQHRVTSAPPGPGGVAHAFGGTFWWAAAIGIVALVPAVLLAVVEHRAKVRATAPEPAPEPVAA